MGGRQHEIYASEEQMDMASGFRSQRYRWDLEYSLERYLWRRRAVSACRGPSPWAFGVFTCAVPLARISCLFFHLESGGVVGVKMFADKPRIHGLRESAVGKTFLECGLL